MSAIQVRNVPPEIHEELRRRAALEHKTLGEVVLDAIRRDLRARTTDEWLERMRALASVGTRPTREQVHEVWQEARGDRRFEGDD